MVESLAQVEPIYTNLVGGGSVGRSRMADAPGLGARFFNLRYGGFGLRQRVFSGVASPIMAHGFTPQLRPQLDSGSSNAEKS